MEFSTIFAIYLACCLTIWWAFFGYNVFLYICANRRQSKVSSGGIVDFPTISILIPCYNEEGLVEDKLRNVTRLEYPMEKLEVIFVDGRSTDTTVSRLRDLAKDIPYVRVVETNKGGIILQLNHVLPQCRGDIIANTDMDCQLREDALLGMVREFQSDPQVGVVGGWSIPTNSLPEDAYYWAIQNKIRVLEGLAFSSFHVVGTFYAFRKGVVERLPEDVLAVDVYRSFAANLKGLRTVYSPRVIAYEVNGPACLYDMLRHKHRRANAMLIEMLRFIYELPKFRPLWKVIFITRFLQMTALPWLLLLFATLTVHMVLLKQYGAVLPGLGIFIVSYGINNVILSRIESPELKGTSSFFLKLKTFLVIFLVLFLTPLTYPFYTQSPSHKKFRGR